MKARAYFHERLSAVDAILLDVEDRCNLMHVAAVLLFEAAPLRGPGGQLDTERVVQHVERRLEDLPRYKQRLLRVPLIQHPVWVDHAGFDVRVHVRPVCLPRPGGTGELQALVSSLVAEPLDRRLPLWELYVVDGLEGDRFAVVAKVHHCIVDGVLGLAVLASLLDVDASPDDGAPMQPWSPRPSPPRAQLLESEVRYRFEHTARLVRKGLHFIDDPTAGRQRIRRFVRGLASYASALLPATATPLNRGWVGPRRQFQWMRIDLDRAKALRRRGRCTLNDVIVATVAGAVRRFLLAEGSDPARATFRVMVPVSRHRGAMDLSEGNRVSIMIARLPVEEADPVRRLERTVEALGAAKSTGQAASLGATEDLADWSTSHLLAEIAHQVMHLRPFNMIVTNVPGPPVPLYLLGARLLEAYPMVPLFVNTGLGVAVLSYAGQMGIGLNADPDMVPRAPAFAGALEDALAELEAALPTIEGAPAEAMGPSAAPPLVRRE
jgi:diacylglycerol O-acyltransferase / wax synthase